MSWLGVILILALIALIFPELYVFAILFVLLILEFILRLFGRSFGDEVIPKTKDQWLSRTKRNKKKDKTITLS